MNVEGPQWLLLDGPGAPQAIETLGRRFAKVQSIGLFEGTELHALGKRGPALVELSACPALARLCLCEPHTWPGLLLFSDVSSARLLEHLRRMLTVSFGLHHRALLSYYNPHTASYFFDACDAVELSRWLGPIRHMRWFGGTWADRATGTQGWQHLFNPGLFVSPLGVEEHLTAHQRERLQTCLLEQHAWQWSRSTGTDYPRLWSHLLEGLALGFNERPVLDGWLWLRLQYPDALLPQALSGLSQQERLDHLCNRWQRDPP
jgi:hypothetical protein